jgi:hypothetical protein
MKPQPRDRNGGAERPSDPAGRRYAAYFHELDAWTEYWDIYHPESQGRFYFGNAADEPGLLRPLLPRDGRPKVFTAWTRMALRTAASTAFASAVRDDAAVRAAIGEVDALLDRVFRAHFGDSIDDAVRADYLEAMFRFATNTLPPATERDASIGEDDPRKATAGHHALEGDLMWFAWALVLEAAALVCGHDGQEARRALLLAGVASGCPADFAWRGHRRTRPTYSRGAATAALLRQRGMQWATDFAAGAEEVHALFRIREWGDAG